MCKGKAQNRIDYIVFHNPEQAAELVSEYGYEPPKDKEELAEAVKLLVKKKGERFIKDLLQIHPEKELILKVTGHNTEENTTEFGNKKASQESNYCGCNSSFNGDIKQSLDQLSGMSANELTALYEEVKNKTKENPQDAKLINQVEAVWDELGRKKKQAAETKQKAETDTNNWYKIGLAFVIGIIIAKVV